MHKKNLEPGEQEEASEERQLIDGQEVEAIGDQLVEAASASDMIDDNEEEQHNEGEAEQQGDAQIAQSNTLSNSSRTDDAKDNNTNHCQETEVIAVEVQAYTRSNSREAAAAEESAENSNETSREDSGSSSSGGQLIESVEPKSEGINNSEQQQQQQQQQSIGNKLWKEER